MLALLVFGLCAAVYMGARWLRARNDPTLLTQLARIQPDSNFVLYVDLTALRAAGIADILGGSPAAEEAEYLHFVTESGFDWRTDLDEVVAARRDSTWHILVRGRFDWEKLDAYMRARSAQCKNAVCDMAASTQGRHISMFPISKSVMALASSTASFEVFNMLRPSKAWLEPPSGPAWISLPAATLTSAGELPSGSRLFAKALEGAQRITLSLDPAALGPALVMRATCKDGQAAAALARQLQGVTLEFRKYFERLGQKPNPGDLSGLLLSGDFAVNGNAVTGRWPVARAFLENLTGGRL